MYGLIDYFEKADIPKKRDPGVQDPIPDIHSENYGHLWLRLIFEKFSSDIVKACADGQGPPSVRAEYFKPVFHGHMYKCLKYQLYT